MGKNEPSDVEIFLNTGGPRPSGLVYVVGVDITERSLAAFYYALKKTQPNDQIKLFHAEKIDVVIDDGLFEHLKGDRKKETLDFFNSLMNECKAHNRYCEIETKSFIGGTSAIGKNICEYAISKQADTIIVGNRELSRLGRTLVGSVSSYLAQLCPLNLIVVKRAPGEK